MENNKNHIEINPSLCKGCQVCVAACPRECIVIGSDINKMGYQYAKFANDNCIACGICFFSCPEFGAITVYKKEK